MAKITPTSDHLVVKAVTEEQTASGIIIPDTAAKEKPQKGEVVAVGPGKFENGQRIPMEVKEGDTVLFTKYGPHELKLDGEDLLVLSESDVMAILN